MLLLLDESDEADESESPKPDEEEPLSLPSDEPSPPAWPPFVDFDLDVFFFFFLGLIKTRSALPRASRAALTIWEARPTVDRRSCDARSDLRSGENLPEIDMQFNIRSRKSNMSVRKSFRIVYMCSRVLLRVLSA